VFTEKAEDGEGGSSELVSDTRTERHLLVFFSFTCLFRTGLVFSSYSLFKSSSCPIRSCLRFELNATYITYNLNKFDDFRIIKFKLCLTEFCPA